MFSINDALEILNKYSEFAVIISIGISIVIALLGVIPSVFITGANILFFGPLIGFLISLAGEVIGGYITFKVYKKGFKKGFDSIKGKSKILEDISNSHGNRAAFLIFQARVIPFIPSGFVTLAASLSSIDDIRYIISTLLGKIPSIMLEALVSYGVLSKGAEGIKIFLTLIALYLIYKTIKKKKV